MINNMYDHLKPAWKHNSDYIILYIGTNDASRDTAYELLDKILALKMFITNKNKNCKVIISTKIVRVDDQQCGSVVIKIN